MTVKRVPGAPPAPSVRVPSVRQSLSVFLSDTPLHCRFHLHEGRRRQEGPQMEQREEGAPCALSPGSTFQ